MNSYTREEHLAWCKKRALLYCDTGDIVRAFESLVSDLNLSDETKNHAGIQLGMPLMMLGELGTVAEMRRFIEGFN